MKAPTWQAATKTRLIGRAQSQVDAHRPMAQLLGLGAATPALHLPQAQIEREMAEIWKLHGASLARWRRIVAASGIERRHAVLQPLEVVHRSTGDRMVLYEQFAPDLAMSAASDALRASHVHPQSITDLIVVSCTGFSAPSVDVALVDRLGLRTNVRRTLIGFMGCFGAISGLRTAVGACAANRDAVVLVVCVELCSLHMRADQSAQNQVASALFADGAAAAILRSTSIQGAKLRSGMSPAPGIVNTGASQLILEGKDWMTWRIADTGFAMTLSRQVPSALQAHIVQFVSSASASNPPQSFAVHPGGPGILDAVDGALRLNGGCGIEVSREVLHAHGNMSSATVLFVLRAMLDRGYALPVMLLAFGPGLTLESISLLP